MNSAGTNNTDSQDSNQIDSGNNNKVSSQSSQQNIHCKTNGSCDNFGGSSWLIRLVSGGDIFSDGSNNIHKQTAVQNSSGNTNTASSSGAQENKNCQENTGCVNFLSTGGLIGL
jgi:hypothetical protein